MDRNEILDKAAELGVKILVASNIGQSQIIAIHLLNPDLGEIDDALDRAERDGFERIVLHTVKTWPMRETKTLDVSK